METDCTLGRNIRFSGALEYKMSECQIGRSSIINKGNLIILGQCHMLLRRGVPRLPYHVRWIHVSLAMDEIWYGCLVFI